MSSLVRPGRNDDLRRANHSITFAVALANDVQHVAFGHVGTRLAADAFVFARIELGAFGRNPLHVIRSEKSAQITLDQLDAAAPI